MSFYMVGSLLEPCIEIWWFFLNLFQILAIENLKKLLILALLIFSFTFCQYIASKKGLTHTPPYLGLYYGLSHAELFPRQGGFKISFFHQFFVRKPAMGGRERGGIFFWFLFPSSSQGVPKVFPNFPICFQRTSQ